MRIRVLLWFAVAQVCLAGRPYHVEHYGVLVKPDLAAKRIDGEVTVKLRSLVDKLENVVLDSGDLTIEEVSEDKAFLPHTKTGKQLSIALKKPAAKGDVRSIRIKYHGTPMRGIRFFPDEVYTAFSTSEWMVCNDDPADLALFSLRLIVPTGMRVAASGQLKRDSEYNGARVSDWEQTTPIPSFVFGFAAGKFNEANEKEGLITLRYLGKDRTQEQLRKIFRVTGAALRYYRSRSAVAYADSSYTQVLAQGSIEQEVAGFTLLSNSYGDQVLQKPDDTWLIAHELAHQWWGIGIACESWTDFWLNEGMATFMADTFLEQQYGNSRYLAEIERSRQRYQEAKDAGKDRPLSFSGWKTPQEASGPIPYHKGAFFLHLLRQKLGDAKFWKGIEIYSGMYFGKTVKSSDFQGVMEAISGENLKGFFDEWVYH
jgi:aminopeptidase N